MKVTSKMFNDNPNLTPKEIFHKVSKERHKSKRRMPSRDERRTENEIVQLETK